MKELVWKLKNLGILAMAFIYAGLFKWPRKKAVLPPQTIAIIQGAKLGDMVCTTPLFRAIKKTYPNSKLIVVGDAVNQKLLAGHPDVDKYVTWRKNFFEVVRALRQEKIDSGIVTLPSLESLAMLLLGNAKMVAAPIIIDGDSPYETSSYKMLRRFAITVPNRNGNYVPREYLRLLEPIGIKTDDTKKHLTYSAAGYERVKKLLEEKGAQPKQDFLVGILPAVGGDKLKLWAPEKFAKIADYLTEKYNAHIIILGSGRDRVEVEKVVAHLSSNTKVINTLDLLSVDELKAMIASLSLFISADTGPVYIAEAFGVATIDIVGPVDEHVQPPRGGLHRTVAAPRQKAMLGVLENIPQSVEEALRQSADISVDMVTKVIDELIPLIKKR
ncbi:MAG: hypothetical protein A2836_01880 [Candidatus Taylorbacteria bacterium RIFCSPHIGHO2_01_FULL_45_63]|uniref:Glycosyl transferase family 9 n=1 Tax=Candidatus Taylorbacteria bacterium RIFCSPHIGHO2_02_FULL_45_35 TaxID=1802311 RepID=A0A1G2MUX4_9BACT|nr:MAG: hypothetical protein A2836_01880 [Candidatus Taylorbacteria bacterium RIFCSPHIGHO2_01_FULL_45_63]OHA27660.1 MAG: hypothetical protein A3D56_00495 [Candidatus Taylorbacteria bacterium RIFCSPHIGHO2_02_FULL_45_35]OHA34781.1 MAG: hypothetical protein A3A22_01995 [Candidatus Taylorbacteria bacterium RIFCSPLOWO2_01_FULL_45_34b]